MASRIKKLFRLTLYATLPLLFIFPIILFVIAGLIGFAKEGMLFSTAGGPLEVAWAAVLMGAGFGWPMWLFSVPWAFVMVYGLAGAQVPGSKVQDPKEN